MNGGKQKKNSQKNKEDAGMATSDNMKPLNPRQQLAVELYTNPTHKDTFGNKVRSAMAAGYTDNYDAARSSAPEIFANPRVRSEIERVLASKKLTVQDRVDVLKEILNSPIIVIETSKIDAEGNEILVQRTKMPNDKSRIAVVRELSRMDGTYARAEAVGRVQSKVLEPFLDEWSRRMRAELSQSAPQAGQEKRRTENTQRRRRSRNTSRTGSTDKSQPPTCTV